jgi:hypothetical protein
LLTSFIQTLHSQNLQDDDLDQEQDVGTIYYDFYDNIYLAQSFIPTLDNLTRIRLKLSKNGDITSNITLSIRKIRINNTDITQATIPSTAISTEKEWVEINFTNTILDLTTPTGDPIIYYIVCRTSGGDINNSYRWWAIDIDNYFHGNAFISSNYNMGWETNYSVDFAFETYGKLIPRLTELQIEYIVGGPGSIIEYGIVNTGETYIPVYYYYCTVNGTFVLIGRSFNGQGIVNLNPGDSADRLLFPIFGLGPARITLEVWTENSESAIVEKDAFIIFSYIYLRIAK